MLGLFVLNLKSVLVWILAWSCALLQTFLEHRCYRINASRNQSHTFCRNVAAGDNHLATSSKCQLTLLSLRENIEQSHHCLDQHHCKAFSKEKLVLPQTGSIFLLSFCSHVRSSHRQQLCCPYCQRHSIHWLRLVRSEASFPIQIRVRYLRTIMNSVKHGVVAQIFWTAKDYPVQKSLRL